MVNNISSILDLINKKIIDKISNKHNINNYLSSDSIILKCYYNFLTILCFFISCSIFYNIFTTDIIRCSNSRTGEEGAENDFLENYCLSYPQLSYNKESLGFALFYKWVPWILILLCNLLYTPKILINHLSCKFIALNLIKITDEVDKMYFNINNKNKNSNDNINNIKRNYDDDDNGYGNDDGCNDDDDDDGYDDDDDKFLLQAKNYINYLIDKRWNKCKYLYLNYLICHIYAFILNILIFFVLDFILQGRFLFYIPNTFPFYRDIDTFSDSMSKIYYPFITCTIPANRIVYGRQDVLKCHLTLMEYYEKIFFIIWIILSVLLFVSFIHVIYIILFLRMNNYNNFLKYLLKKHLNYDLYLYSEKIMLKKKKKNINLLV